MALGKYDPLLARVKVLLEHDEVVPEIQVQLAGIALRKAAAATWYTVAAGQMLIL